LARAADRQADWATAWRPGPAEDAARGAGAGALAAWSLRGGHTCGDGVARLVHVLRRTRCLRNGGASTVGAVATRLTRWRWRWLTQTATRRVGAERRQHGDVQRWRRCSGDGWRWWRGPAMPNEKGEGEAHANWKPRRMEDRLTEDAENRRPRWPGLPVVRRPEDGPDRLTRELGGSGARSGWRRKMEMKGSEVGDRRLLRALKGAGGEGEKEEGVSSVPRGARGGRGGPVARSTARSGSRPSGAGSGAVARQRRAAGHGRHWREWPTGGTGRQRGSVGSDGVREVEEKARRWVLTHGPHQHSAGARFKLSLNRFKSIQRFRNRFKIPPYID
jgi:hypothetical protein